ncbi:MAG: hypothetical protein WC956_05085 [bacterium]
MPTISKRRSIRGGAGIAKTMLVLLAFAAVCLARTHVAICEDTLVNVGAINHTQLRPIGTISGGSAVDSDGDGLLDSEEGDRDGDGKLEGSDECDPKLADTDGDGVPDGDERRFGTRCNVCDTDNDALSDGVELGYIQPEDKNGCHGLTAAGTNYRKPHVMDPLNPDSDGDGLNDGLEDKNGNGWVDPDETDPSIEDTDKDGLSDYVETTGDFNGDGMPDFDFRLINNGSSCNPPAGIEDLDCDGIPNARDDDSDNDGCPDSQEGGWVDTNVNGVPDIYDSGAKSCPEPSESSPPAQGGNGAAAGDGDDKAAAEFSFPRDGYDGGGACALVQRGDDGGFMTFPRVVGLVSLMLIGAGAAFSLARRRA